MKDIEIVLPQILTEGADAIHDRMLNNAPADINTIEGDIYWDTTRPTAETVAEMVHMKLIPALFQGFAQTASGAFLDLHGDEFGAHRKDPNISTGTITVTGSPGTRILKGSVFTTQATEDAEAIEFVTTSDGVIGASNTANIPIAAVVAGNGGNVAAGAITHIKSTTPGLQSVTNPTATANGTDEETDDAYRKRVIFAKREKAESGNKVDYMRWALEVPGVGYVYVTPIWDGPGTVKVTILDEHREPAGSTLLQTVQTYISPKDSRDGDGQAPVGAVVTVTTPTIKTINIAADITTQAGADTDTIKEHLTAKLNAYLESLDVWDTLIYKAVEGIFASLILEEKGITDYSALTINGGVTNIAIVEELPRLGTVTLT